MSLHEIVLKQGFASVEEFNALVASADVSTPEKYRAFKEWQTGDGSKEGLLALQPRLIGKPEVTREGALDMQVCVPASWTDEQVVAFAEKEYPCGTQNGWRIRRQGSAFLAGAKERTPCTAPTREGYVHIMLDA